MTNTQILFAVLAAFAFALALFAAWRERRDDLDAVGIVDWTTVQMAAILAVMVLAGLAFRA